MTTSADARLRLAPFIMTASTARPTIENAVTSGIDAGSLVTSTAITTSTFICRAASTGTLSRNPPSTSRRPSIVTGGKIPGIAIVARIASARMPRSSTTLSDRLMSNATQRNGVGRSSKVGSAE